MNLPNISKTSGTSTPPIFQFLFRTFNFSTLITIYSQLDVGEVYAKFMSQFIYLLSIVNSGNPADTFKEYIRLSRFQFFSLRQVQVKSIKVHLENYKQTFVLYNILQDRSHVCIVSFDWPLFHIS